MHEASATELVVAGVLPQDRRKNETRHVRFDRSVAKCRCVANSVGAPALAIPGLAISRLTDARNCGNPGKLKRIKYRPRDQLKFPANRQRRERDRTVDGHKIRHGIEKAIFRGVSLSLSLVF